MHDLDVHNPDGTLAAVEVVAAADAESIELCRLGNPGELWVEPGLQGGWIAWLRPTARAKRLRERLPALLRNLESRGMTEVVAASRSWRLGNLDEQQVDELGIETLRQSDTSVPGSIYLSIQQPAERSGGFVSASGSAVVAWLGDYLHGPETADVRGKLRRSGCVERHAFVWVPGFTTAPFGVTEFLLHDVEGEVPDAPPDLPVEVTNVWVLSKWAAGSGLRWSPDCGWKQVPARGRTGPDRWSGQPGRPTNSLRFAPQRHTLNA